MERKPKWAWELYPLDDALWKIQYHDDPMDHLLDPRRFDSVVMHQQGTEPESSEEKPVYSDPAAAKPPKLSSLERMKFDEKLYKLAFGRVVRRPASPDNTFVGKDGCDTEALAYRTHPYADRKPYPPRKPSEKLHFERLNATQFKLYSTEQAKNTQSKDWLRCGSLYHDFVDAQKRKELGDVSSSDQQGLLYLLEKRIAENKAGPVSDRWTARQIRRGRYYVNSLLDSMVPDSEFFRNDLFIYNGRNNNNLQSIGMDSLTTIFVRKDPRTKETRTDRTSQVLMELSKFENLCPNSEDRQLLRMLLGHGDDLKSTSYLLSPFDAARLSQSMLVLPRQDRDLTVFKASLQGNISTNDSEILFPSSRGSPPAYLPPRPVPVKVDRATVKQSQRTPWANAVTYFAVCQEIPKESPPASPLPPTTEAATPTSKADEGVTSVVQIPVDVPETSVPLVNPGTTTSNALPTPVLSSTTIGPFERLQHAYNRIVDPVPTFSMEDFSSWLYLYQSASDDSGAGAPDVIFPDKSPSKNTLDTELPLGFPTLTPVLPEHTCAVDPRSDFPATYIHPPIQLGVYLYDDYRSSQEDSDDDILRAFTPPPRFDTPTPDSDPELFSGLATPDSASNPADSEFKFPSATTDVNSAFPVGSSTPDKSDQPSRIRELMDPADDVLTKYSKSNSKYIHGPPGHRDPVNEDFPLMDPVTVDTCVNHAEHTSNLFYMFTSRILQRGRRKELFFLAMAYPEASLYLQSARCLRGLTSAQRQRVIGPFTSAQREAYNARFNPTRMEYTRRLETYDRLYSINVPDTSADFDSIPTPPAFKYIAERKLREALFPIPSDPDQLRFGQPHTAEYVTESITDSEDEDTQPYVHSESSTLPPSTVSDSELPGYSYSSDDLLKKTSVTGHFLGEIWGPYFSGSLLQDIPLDLSFDEFLDELDTQLVRGPIQLDSTEYNELPSGYEDQSTQFANMWARKQLSQLDNVSFLENSDDSSSTCSSTYSTTESALTTDSEPEPELAESVTTAAISATKPALLVPRISQHRFKGEEDLLQSLARRGKAKQKIKNVITQFTLPPTVVPIPQGYHQEETAKKRTIQMDVHSSFVVHPVTGEIHNLDFDMAPDTHAHFHRREYNRHVADLPSDQSRDLYSTDLQSLLQYHRIDPETKIPYFVSGTVYNYIFDHLRPQTVSLGYQKALTADERDALSQTYPDVLSCLRGNVDVTAVPLTRLALYSFLAKDPRFQVLGTHVHRPQLFHYTICMLEPTLFTPYSYRPWVSLLSDVDTHSWSPLSSFTCLCGRAEVLKKVFSLNYYITHFPFS
ncbi:unnamed protein product [Oikopleura dioica]|uniref:Uncharacterized protein n=1 Tax=Oikopleura dioica TaxID=34765 RepID=E4XUE0_OIKDI|nr:unnamed protein product [Oikopleura dioica]